jgi:single-stranded-DNA-specific exonuclease
VSHSAVETPASKWGRRFRLPTARGNPQTMLTSPTARTMPARWLFPAPDAGCAVELSAALGVGSLLGKVLAARGLTDAERAHRFLHPSLTDLYDPFALRDMETAVARLLAAIAAREGILIYGDYDVDGTTAVVLLMTAIRLAGGSAFYHVPHRLKDGYGMRSSVVEDAAARGVKLIVSVDTGIRAAEVVKRAAELGIATIVTDHHLPEAELPPALAVLNPNRSDCGYPNKDLCGAGVAFKLAQALLERSGRPAERVARVSESLLKLVAIATVGDIVPLTGENRAIVKLGLDGLSDVRNIGLQALLEVAGFARGASIGARQVAFQIVPRINAAGRMDTAQSAIELFLTTDPARAHELAKQLHDQNVDRRQVEAAICDTCQGLPADASAAALVYYAKDWHRGVVGIVANRLMDRLHRPVFVLGRSEEDGMAQGSGRSIPAFDLLGALESMRDLFVRFGGHKYAAGVTLEPARVEEFRRRFNAYAAARLTAQDFAPRFEIDAVAELGEIDEAAVADVLDAGALRPRQPRAARRRARRGSGGGAGGDEGEAPANRVRQNGRSLTLKAWNFSARAAEFAPGAARCRVRIGRRPILGRARLCPGRRP